MNGTEEILKNRDIKKIFSAEIRVRSILFGGKQSNLQIINWQDLFKILGVIV